jgi:hypothetical protein
MGGEPQDVSWPILWFLLQVLEPLNQIDAALGLAFLDIEVPFEIVVFCLFRDFSKAAHLNRNFGVGSPMEESAGGNKTNMGAGEIDPGGTGGGIEIRRGAKTYIVIETSPAKGRGFRPGAAVSRMAIDVEAILGDVDADKAIEM